MAGTLIINDRTDWLPPGWLFDSVLDGLAAELPPTSRLAVSLRVARTEGGSGFLDLREWSGGDVSTLLGAARRLRERRAAEGPGGFHDPRGFRPYLQQLEQLIDGLARDSRTGESR
jgi:hypothetical protein